MQLLPVHIMFKWQQWRCTTWQYQLASGLLQSTQMRRSSTIPIQLAIVGMKWWSRCEKGRSSMIYPPICISSIPNWAARKLVMQAILDRSDWWTGIPSHVFCSGNHLEMEPVERSTGWGFSISVFWARAPQRTSDCLTMMSVIALMFIVKLCFG